MSCASTRWTAPRCGSARHRPRHASLLRTVTVRGAPGGRNLPSRTGHEGHGAGCLRGGSGVCQGKPSKITRKLMGGQGLLSIRWAGWNPAAHLVKGGASSAPHSMHRHSLYAHRVERAGMAAAPTRAGGACGAAHRRGGCGAPVRWCGGWECMASSAGAPVRPMHRTERTGCRDVPHSPHRMERTEWSPPDALHCGLHSPGGLHSPVQRSTHRARGGVHRGQSSPAAAPSGAPQVRPASGVLP